ncbi:MAG: tail fiber domain-containing protein, partial [Bacteroidia bacterium]
LGTGTSTAGAESGVLQLYNDAGAIGVQIFSQGNSWITGSNVGIGTTSPSYKLDVSGDVRATGVMSVGTTPSGSYRLTINGDGLATGFWVDSDQQFKTNVDSLQDALSIINQIRPKTYNLDTANVWGFNFDNQKQHGVIAQQLEQVLPELVKTSTKQADYDSLGNEIHPAITFKAVNYIGLVPVLIKGMQEQQQTIDSLHLRTNVQDSIITSIQNQLTQVLASNILLQDQMNQIITKVNSCCNRPQESSIDNQETKSIIISGTEDSNKIDVELNNYQAVVLEQNVPNPFAERTSINYFLPDDSGKAQILFYNSNGSLIQSVELLQKGKGTLNVFSAELSKGTYTYAIVVDGKVIEVKKMVKQ